MATKKIIHLKFDLNVTLSDEEIAKKRAKTKQAINEIWGVKKTPIYLIHTESSTTKTAGK